MHLSSAPVYGKSQYKISVYSFTKKLVSQKLRKKKKGLFRLRRKPGAGIGLFLLRNSIYLQGTYKSCFHKQQRTTSKRCCFRIDFSKIVSASIQVQNSFRLFFNSNIPWVFKLHLLRLSEQPL